MILSVVRVYQVYLMNVEQCEMAADPQTKPTNLGRQSTPMQIIHQKIVHQSNSHTASPSKQFLQFSELGFVSLGPFHCA